MIGTGKKHGSKMTISTRRALVGIAFSSPLIIGLLFLYITPIVRSLWISLCNMVTNGGKITISWVGLEKYYNALFVDPSFVRNITTNFQNSILLLPLILLFSFFIAIILNQKFKGRIVARLIFFLPVVIYSGVLMQMQDSISVGMMNTMSSSNTKTAMDSLNFSDTIMRLLPVSEVPFLKVLVNTLVSNLYTIITQSGVQILVFLAGLQTIPPSIYEASSVEGCTPWENFWKITVPMLSPMILVNAIYTIIDLFTGIQNPVVKYIYNVSVDKGDYALSFAMNWLYIIVIFAFTAVVYFIISRYLYYENREKA